MFIDWRELGTSEQKKILYLMCISGHFHFFLVFNLRGTRLWRLFYIPLMQKHTFYIPNFWKWYVNIHRYVHTNPSWNPASTSTSTPHYVPVFKNWTRETLANCRSSSVLPVKMTLWIMRSHEGPCLSSSSPSRLVLKLGKVISTNTE